MTSRARRILLAIGNLALLAKPAVHLFGREFWLLDVGGLIGVVGMMVIMAISIAKNTRTLYLQERLR